MAFVAMGFDHVVANMFFLPAAIFAGDPNIGWGDAGVNWLLAGAGNLVGAVVYVATSYWYLFLKDQPVRSAHSENGSAREPANGHNGDFHRQERGPTLKGEIAVAAA